MQIKYFPAFFLVVSFQCLLTAGIYAQQQGDLEKKINQLLQEQKLSGAVWSVVGDSGNIYANSAGLNNMATNEKLKPSHKVHIGSVTKTILALGILHLATNGKINIDDPVKKYLPDLPIVNPWENTNHITVRHLLDHTSGLSDLRFWHFFSTSSVPNTPLSAFYRKSPKVLSVKAKPGSLFSYSNMGYTLLGMIIESVTKKAYEKYLDEHLLKPLGMVNSTFEFVSQVGNHADEQLAMGHLDNGEIYPAMPIYLRPAGQFTTTAYDMGLLLKFLMSEGKINEAGFVDKTFLAALGKPAYTIASKNGLPNGYSLGAMQRDRHHVLGIVHSGNIIGYRAMLYFFPEQKKGFFISHNMDSETADYEVFNKVLIEYLQIPEQKAKITEVTANALSNWQGYYVPFITKIEPLGLLDIAGNFTKVQINEFGAVLTPFQKKPAYLHYEGNNLFRADDRVAASHSFYKNERNEQFITSGIITLKKISGFRIFFTVFSLALGVIAVLYVLVAGIFEIIKYKKLFLKRYSLWSFIAILILFAAAGMMAAQPFISIGDKTTGNVLLAIGTVLLPLLTVVSIFKQNKQGKRVYKSVKFWIYIFILQFCVLLVANDLIPFILWK